jgi:hypothetical protein
MTVSRACEPAPGAATNEDHVLHVGPLVAVFDGVSAPEGLDTGCVHGASWYVRRLADRLAEAIQAAPDVDLRRGLATAIGSVRDDHGDRCDLEHPGTPAASLCILHERGDSLDYLILSDCTLVVDRAGQTEMYTDARFTAAMADIRASALTGDAPIGSHEHALQVRRAMQQRQQRMNRPNGYWIAAADPGAATHALTGRLPLDGPERTRRAALLTDGAADAVDRYHLLDWSDLLDSLTQHGPHELIRLVREAERGDIAGHAQPRYKRHDDATAVLCLFHHREQP